MLPRQHPGQPENTLPPLPSLLHNFFFQCRIPGTCFPQKGRSEGDASEKRIASFTALNTQNPRRNKIYSRLFSIIPGKEPAKEHETKLENEVTNRQAKNSTNQRKEERKQNAFPTITSIIVLRIQIAFTQATTY